MISEKSDECLAFLFRSFFIHSFIIIRVPFNRIPVFSTHLFDSNCQMSYLYLLHILDIRVLKAKYSLLTGLGIFMVGVVLLSIGLIIGLEFPVYVTDKIVKDQCILDKDHAFYDKWVR